jgi:hypothetical protein
LSSSGGINLLSFLRPKNPRKRSVLARQRVKAGSQKGAGGRPAWSVAAKGLLVVLVVVVVWGLGLRLIDKITDVSSYVASSLVMPPKEWRIEVINGAGTQLPDEVRRDVYKIALKGLKTGSPGELRVLARQVEAAGQLESVRVVRPLIDTVILTAEIRRPTLLIDVGGRTRFLTADGTVFGDAGEAGAQPNIAKPTVRLTGIFDQRPNPPVDTSSRVITNSDERRHVRDALDVWRLVEENNIPVKQLNFQKFRGYALTLQDDTEIVIGLKPFAYKLKKLNDILTGLARDGIVASRIELDYEGKAFIKERKL